MLETESKNHSSEHAVSARKLSLGRGADISQLSIDGPPDPIKALRNSDDYSLSDLLETIIHWAQNEFGIEEFTQALSDFQQIIGRVFHDEPFYHERMTYFLDYFTFQRPLIGNLRENDNLMTPYLKFMQSDFLKDGKLPQRVIDEFSLLEKNRHSIFQIVKIQDIKMTIKDLVTGLKSHILPRDYGSFQGFNKSDILQGFVFDPEGRARLSTGVIIHPSEVARTIKTRLTKSRKTQEFEEIHFFAKLARQNAHYLRHRNICPKKVYLQDRS